MRFYKIRFIALGRENTEAQAGPRASAISKTYRGVAERTARQIPMSHRPHNTKAHAV